MAAAEQRKQYLVIKDFRGINTHANRTAIPENEFSWLENAMPVGSGNLKIIPAQISVTNSGGNVVTWTTATTYLTSSNINLSDYVVSFQSNGAAENFNIQSATKNSVAVSGKFSGSGLRTAQWKNERLLIIDPSKGLYSWDGNNVVSIGSVGTIAVTNPGTGYTSAPSVAISAPNDANGVQATAQVSLTGNTVSSISLTNAGSGYTGPVTVTLTGGGGSGATAVGSYISFATGTVAINIQSGGTGYTTPSTIVVGITGGGGSGAAATAVVAGNVIIQIVMTNLGTGYTSPPAIAITGGGGSGAIATATVTTSPNVDVATFSGRVWVAQGRTVYYSAAGSYSDFVTVSAGAVTLTDETLHGNIQGLLSANNFLYIFGDDSINVFSDVRVQSNGTTIFTNTNVSASVGTKRISSVFPYFRSVLLMNDYGVYALVGSTTTKLSDALDGIFPLIDFTFPVNGGQVLLNGILCAAFSFYYQDPVQGTRPIQAVFFDKKWFLTSQGSIKYITGVPVGGVPSIYGTDGTSLVKLYQSSTASISSNVQSALWTMGDIIRDKQALKFGIEATLTNSGVFNVTVDSQVNSSPIYTLTNQVPWFNSSGAFIPWVNNVSSIIPWDFTNGYYLYKSDAQQWGKYIGLTITSTYGGFVINTLETEHELRARF